MFNGGYYPCPGGGMRRRDLLPGEVVVCHRCGKRLVVTPNRYIRQHQLPVSMRADAALAATTTAEETKGA